MISTRKDYSINLQTSVLFSVAICLLLTDLVFTTSSFSRCSTLMISIGLSRLVLPHEFNLISKLLSRLNRRFYLPTVLLFVVSALFLLNYLTAPASAQFYQGAETELVTFFPEAEEVIALVFNVLRALFIIYVGISVVKIVQAQRQDEDWQSLARTPFIILIAVTIGDILAGFILGTGAGV